MSTITAHSQILRQLLQSRSFSILVCPCGYTLDKSNID